MSCAKSQCRAFIDSEYVEEIARILHPEDSKWRTLAVLDAYFDDSGTHEGSLVVCIGGCIARASQWSVFATEWRRVLEKFSVSVFHSADLASSQGEFEGWDDARKRALLSSLAGVMGQYSKSAIACVVVVREYAVVPAWARATAAFGDEYNFCFQMCVGMTMSWVDQLNPPMPESEQVAFVFDQRPKGEGITRDNYFYIKKFRDPNDRMGTLAFADKRRFLALQAADFVAYECYKRADNEERQSGRPLRGSLKVLVENLWQFNATIFRQDDLQNLLVEYERKGYTGAEPWWPWRTPVAGE